jgi:hypothetical protein
MAEPFSAIACGALKLAIQIKDNLDRMEDNKNEVAVLKAHVAGILHPLQILYETTRKGTPLQSSIAEIVTLAMGYLRAAEKLAEEVHDMPWLKAVFFSKPIAEQLKVVGNHLQSAIQSIGLHLQVEARGQWQAQQQAQQASMQQLFEMQQKQQMLLQQNQQLLQQMRGTDAAPGGPACVLAAVSSMMEARGLCPRQARADIDSALNGQQGYGQEDKEVGESRCATAHAITPAVMGCHDAVCAAAISSAPPASRTPP